MHKLVRSLTFLTLALALSLAARPFTPLPHWAEPTTWPVERMVANLTRIATENPEDAKAHFELGRVHSLAFTLEAKELGIWHEEPFSPLDDFQQRLHYGRGKPHRDGPTPETMRTHVQKGIEHLRRSIDLAPQRAEAHLSLGHLTESAAHLAPGLDTHGLLRLPQIRITRDTHEEILQHLQALGSTKKSTRRRAFKELQERRFFLASLTYLEKEVSSSNRERSDAARELLRRFWIEQAIAHYRTATDIALPTDLQLETKPMVYQQGDGLDQLASYEAGRSWVRLVAERDPLDEAEKEALATTRAALKRLEDLPPANAITPLILTFDAHASLADLLLPEQPVLFDLDGDGTTEAWPWVRPGVAFVVWDPEQTGHITSARQMFGTASAQVFFGDGYRALAALDDDGDASLTGSELQGLSLWFDDDCDGLSDPGEVFSVTQHEITALATRATGTAGGNESLVSTSGVSLRDGRRLPSYDWVTRPYHDQP